MQSKVFSQTIKNSIEQNKLDTVLNIIFRKHELEMFQNRVAIIQLLIAGKTYEEVRKRLGVGIDTIAKMSAVLELHKEELETLLPKYVGSEVGAATAPDKSSTMYSFGTSE